jgi:hypothetical protein
MTLVPADQHNGYGQVQQYQPQYPQQLAAQRPAPAGFSQWIEDARQLAPIAESLSRTSFVPKAFFGKPAEVTAAILAGQEVGLPAMAALRSIDVIEGKPGMSAIALRALIQSHGHDIWVVESTATRAIVKGRRKGAAHEETSTWTIDRARQLELTGKSNWKKQPTAMLLARATSECARLIAADVILGMPYSSEELLDGVEATDEPTELTAAVEDKPGRRTAKRKPLERAEPDSEPPLPPARATVERAEPAAEEAPAQPVEQPQPSRVDAQARRMFALFNETAFKEREERLTFIGEIVGREVESSNDLSADDKSLVIAALERHIGGMRQADEAGGE